MKEILRALVSAQRLDDRIAVLSRRRADLPVELAERESSQAALEAEAEALELERRSSQARSHELDVQAQADRGKIEDLERKARGLRDAGAVQVAQHEAENLRARISEAEEEGLRLLEEVDVLSARIAAMKERVAAGATELEQFRARVAADIRSLDAELEARTAERDSILGTLPPARAEDYRKLLALRGGRALSPLRGESCGACGMAVPPNDQNGVKGLHKLIPCRTCNRILVPAEFWKEETSETPAVGETGS